MVILRLKIGRKENNQEIRIAFINKKTLDHGKVLETKLVFS